MAKKARITQQVSNKNQQTQTQDNKWLANFLASRNMTEKEFKKVMIELVEQTKFLTRQDHKKWRAAWQRALSVEYPNRVDLLAVYRDIEIDGHLTGAIGQIKTEVLQKVFKIVDRDTEEELPDLKKHLTDKQWFIDFCEIVILTVFYGHSLVQFGDIAEVNGVKKFLEVEVVDRENVIPEHHVFVKNMGDHWRNGIDYTQPPYSDWCIGIGNKKDLGLFNKVAPHALSKKNVLAFWDKFAEIFGMPLRIAKTSSNNPTERNKVSSMLQNMGAAAWGLFPDGTDIEIKETTRGDSYQVYDKRVERANSEMSKAIVHQTMTTDNGSSKAQGEVHLTIQEKVIEYFAVKLRIVVNDSLVPFLTLHGFQGWENAKFKYDDTLEMSVEEQTKIEEMLLNNFECDASYFEKKYGVKIIGRKQTTTTPANGFFD